MVMWAAAPRINSTRKAEVMGASTLVVGKPPRLAVDGKYGGPEVSWNCGCLLVIIFVWGSHVKG
jgi:hypothetical protein